LSVVAVEPVWYLPGVAARFGIDEGVLRRGLFEDTGGSYPELITRGDLKVFLPPIGILPSEPNLTDSQVVSQSTFSET
jgi:GTP cyclohydrolase N terminal